MTQSQGTGNTGTEQPVQQPPQLVPAQGFAVDDNAAVERPIPLRIRETRQQREARFQRFIRNERLPNHPSHREKRLDTLRVDFERDERTLDKEWEKMILQQRAKNKKDKERWDKEDRAMAEAQARRQQELEAEARE